MLERGRGISGSVAEPGGVERAARTGLGGKRSLVRQQAADPRHDVVDVLRRRQLDLLAVLVDPCIVESFFLHNARTHARAGDQSERSVKGGKGKCRSRQEQCTLCAPPQGGSVTS